MKRNQGLLIGGLLAGTAGLIYWKWDYIKPHLNFNTSKPSGGSSGGPVTSQTIKDFVRDIYPSAKVIGNNIGVPPLFILAQLALESKYGKSSLTKQYYNFGGIKAVPGQKSVSMLTTECKDGVCGKVFRDFAVFPNATEGLKAQAKIYQNVYFKKYLNKTKDPVEYARLLQSGKPKYATALNYVSTIQDTIGVLKRTGMV